MIFRLISTAILTFSFCVSAWGWTVDLTSRFGKVRNQGKSNFCHSFIAADLLDEFLGEKNYISALGMSLNVVNPSLEMQEALPRLAVKSTSAIHLRINSPFLSMAAFGVKSMLSDDPRLCLEKDLPSETKDQMNDLYIHQKLQVRNNFSKDDQLFVKTANYYSRSCKGPSVAFDAIMQISNLQGQLYNNGESDAEKMAMVVGLLNQKRPVAIGYNLRPMISDDVLPEAHHFSVIVAHGGVEGSRTFKVRHTYGTDCTGYRGKRIPNCVDGYQTVEGNKLFAYVEAIMWFPSTLADARNLQNQQGASE